MKISNLATVPVEQQVSVQVAPAAVWAEAV